MFNQYRSLVFAIAITAFISSCSKCSSSTVAPASVTVSTLAGTGSSGAVNGTSTAASFSFPSSMVFSSGGAMYIRDFGK